MRFQFDLYTRNYHSLPVGDLLDARDAYHVHLAHLENVYATAIGLFRIRTPDPDADDNKAIGHAAQKRGQYKEVRAGDAKKAQKPKPGPQMAVSKKRNHAKPKLRKRA